jgi:hypothetical protein
MELAQDHGQWLTMESVIMMRDLAATVLAIL